MPNLLRPNTFKEFIGQEKLKATFEVIIKSAKKRRKTIDHILLYGKPGIGKTSLAILIAKNLETRIRYAQGSTLDKKSDILSLFAQISKGDVIFIDEIHGINKNIEELIYSALEDGVIDVVIGPEGDSRIVRMKLAEFTLIGATTKMGKISAPLKERFGIVSKLNSYDEKDLVKIIAQSSKILKWKINQKALELIASYSRLIPRLANNLLKRVIDFAIVDELKEINIKIVQKTFKSLGFYKYGLTDQHIQYLKCLSEIFYAKSASIDSLIGILGENRESVEIDIEPILLAKGLMIKSSRGRQITNKGIEYIKTYDLI